MSICQPEPIDSRRVDVIRQVRERGSGMAGAQAKARSEGAVARRIRGVGDSIPACVLCSGPPRIAPIQVVPISRIESYRIAQLEETKIFGRRLLSRKGDPITSAGGVR